MKFLLLTLFTFGALSSANASSKLDSFYSNKKSINFCKSNLISGEKGNYLRINTQQKFFAPYVVRVQTARGESEVTFIDINTKQKHIYEVGFTVKDVLYDQNRVLILSNAGIHAGTIGNKALKLHKTSKYDYSDKEDYPSQMIAKGQYLYVAHAGLGVSVLAREGLYPLFVNSYNSKVNKGSQRSSVNGIAFRGDNVFLALDNITYDYGNKKRAFEGMIKLNSALNVEKIIPLKQSREAYHMPRLINTPKALVMQNLHLLFTYNDSALKKKTAEPTKRLFKFKDGELFGKPLIYDNKIYGCFLKYENDEFTLTSGIESL